jgi:predicted RNA-binding Zn-ribbon protein involved in translation (DUF1610 family)
MKPTNKCDNCGWKGPDKALKKIKDLAARVDPGSEVPSGECPKCGALAYVIRKLGRPPKKPGEKQTVVLHVYLTKEESVKLRELAKTLETPLSRYARDLLVATLK